MTGPQRPTPEIRPGTATHRLIRGVMRMDVDLLYVERVVLLRTNAWKVSLVDTGDGDATPWTPGGDTTFHILWQADEDDAWVEASGDRVAIAPGDTMSVPSGTGIRLAAGMLLVQVEARTSTLEMVIAPSHGVETFEGYNRRTDFRTPAAFTMQRWKITQPLTMPPSDAPCAVIDLATPLAMAWAGGTDLIRRGECRVIPGGTRSLTLLPDGLGYALVIR